MNLKRTGEEVADRLNRQLAAQAAQAAQVSSQVSKQVTKQTSALLERLLGMIEQAERIQAEMATRAQAEVARRVAVIPQPKPRRGRTVLVLMAGAGAGYLVAYLFDQERGRARRAEIGRRLESAGREAGRTAQRTVMMAGDRASGIKHMVTRPGDDSSDDLTILDRVESEVFADPSIPKGDINVMVVDGKAVLRGQVETKQIGAIEAAVRKVVGVRDVENLLHPPGTPAPNKAEARSAVGNGGSRSDG